MKPVQRDEFVPNPSLSKPEMKAMQRRIADAALFDSSRPTSDSLIVAGVDQGFTNNQSVSHVVAMREGDIIAESSASHPTQLPYIPGLLAFREGNAIIAALKQLDVTPDVLLLDGSGRIHYREAGIATHIGVVFDIPSVGVAKNLLCGSADLPARMEEGERRPVLSDTSIETVAEGELIGYAYQSRQYDSSSQHINPLFVSPGHRVDDRGCVSLVSRLCSTYKLPEPVRLADKRVDEVKQRF